MDLKGKKLLILGANPETAGLVTKANELGIYTIVTDYDPNAYAKNYAQKPININAVDLDSLVEFSQKEKVDGVLVGVAEALLPTYYELCKKLDLPCYSDLDLLQTMADKKRFKEVCRQYDVPVVEEYMIEYGNEESYKKVKLPVVVKPVDSCSSKGISVCNTYEELVVGIEKALTFSKSKTLLIEKYMTGEEVIVYYIFQEGEPILVAMCDRYTNKEQKGVAQLPTSYVYPSRHLEKYQAMVDEKVKAMFRGVGIKHGVMFIQSFVEEDGEVRFYEAGYRLNGAQEHYLVNAATGIDAKELMINFALTGKMSDEDLRHKASPNFNGKICCKLSPLVRPGKIAKMCGLDEIRGMKEVVAVNPSYHVGDVVTGFGTLKQIICRFFIVAESKEELKIALKKIEATFIVEDADGNSMFLEQFDPEIITNVY